MRVVVHKDGEALLGFSMLADTDVDREVLKKAEAIGMRIVPGRPDGELLVAFGLPTAGQSEESTEDKPVYFNTGKWVG